MPATSPLKDKLPLLVSAAVVVALVACYYFIPAFHDEVKEAFKVLTSNNREQISQWVGQYGFWGPIWLVAAMVVQMFLVVINVVALMVVAVLAYGPVWGSLVALSGIVVASTIAYLLGYWLGPHTVKRLVGAGTQQKMQEAVECYGFWAIIVTRISPFLSNDAVGFVAGLVRMSYFKFIMATFIGILPLMVLIAWLSTEIDRLKDGLIWVSVVSIAGFGLYVWLHSRHKKKKKAAHRGKVRASESRPKP